ncbi:MAG: hypothetical protein JJU26_13240 [Oceanicaulis sp.]|uniref:hypothetical protein n=1 Tax=Glycocaulis sp. TaxID=1969725 RepID=UPI0025C68F5A|nr:hypothetical protein [Glycocaulis sp.]MCC5982671.1 hypothetical protein [Oceanicaulis sp.]MCH8522385.1 hypothetical protein [Glycocaulis sp.]
MVEKPKLTFFEEAPANAKSPAITRTREEVLAATQVMNKTRGISPVKPRSRSGPIPKERTRSDRITARTYPEHSAVAKYLFEKHRAAGPVLEAAILQFARDVIKRGSINDQLLSEQQIADLQTLVDRAASNN